MESGRRGHKGGTIEARALEVEIVNHNCEYLVLIACGLEVRLLEAEYSENFGSAPDSGRAFKIDSWIT